MIRTFRPRQQQRSLVLTKEGERWRVSTIPPAPHTEPILPQTDKFDSADAALGYAARIASRTGWNLVDQTGRRSPAELEEAIRRAAEIEFPEDGS